VVGFEGLLGQDLDSIVIMHSFIGGLGTWGRNCGRREFPNSRITASGALAGSIGMVEGWITCLLSARNVVDSAVELALDEPLESWHMVPSLH